MTEGDVVLVVEDDPVLGPAMVQRLRLEGFEPRLATTGEMALRELAARRPSLIVSDIRLPDMSGEEVFRRTVQKAGLVPTFFMTAFGDVSQAVRLVKAGARDYMIKPVDVDALVGSLKAALAGSAPAPLRAPDASLGDSPAIRAVEALLRKAARIDLPVVLLGETGTGKEVAARFLHRLMQRPSAPFIAVNCAAIPKDLVESTLFGHERGAFTGAVARHAGLAERADGGVLFLDEIAELSLDLQAKLLRLVQERTYLPVGARSEKPFGGRLVCATHADLKARVGDGTFREDLYFRINVLEIRLPPLRQRAEDIPVLAESFLRDAAERFQTGLKRVDPSALAALLNHDWPGNVRELRNRIERAVAISDGESISIDDLFPEGRLDEAPLAGGEQVGIGDVAREAIRTRVREALRKTGGNQTEAAKLLNVSRTTIWKYAR